MTVDKQVAKHETRIAVIENVIPRIDQSLKELNKKFDDKFGNGFATAIAKLNLSMKILNKTLAGMQVKHDKEIDEIKKHLDEDIKKTLADHTKDISELQSSSKADTKWMDRVITIIIAIISAALTAIGLKATKG